MQYYSVSLNFVIFISLLFNFTNETGSNEKSRKENLQEIWRSIAVQSAKCTHNSCAKRKNVIENFLTDEQLRLARIEIIKRRILESLGLDKPPIVHYKFTILPDLIVRNGELTSFVQNISNYRNFPSDKIILFPSANECSVDENSVKVYISYDLPAQLLADDIDSSHLWIHWTHDDDNMNKLFNRCNLLSSTCGKNSRILYKSNFHLGRLNSEKDGNWEKVNIEISLKSWLEFREFCYNLTLSCELKSHNDINKISNKCPVTMESTNKPFISITVSPLEENVREKRNNNCLKGSTECCRESLYVNFTDIGWNTWIYKPDGYDAFFCKGSCSSAASITLSSSHHNTIMRKLIYQKTTRGEEIDVTPCCTPTKFLPLQIIYWETNETLKQRITPNLIVDSCGCL